MKRLILSVVFGLALAGASLPAQADLSFSNDKLSFSFNATNRYDNVKGGRSETPTGMDAYMGAGLSIGNFEHASMGIHPRWFEGKDGVWRPSDTMGYLYFSAGGQAGEVKEIKPVSQELRINVPSMKLSVNEYLSMYSYREGEGGGKGAAPLDDENTIVPAAPLPLGKLWSHVNGSFSTSSFRLDGNAQSHFDEWESDWDGVIRTRYSAGFSVPIVAINGFTIPAEGVAFTAVPEPACLGFVGLASLGLIGRRRRH